MVLEGLSTSETTVSDNSFLVTDRITGTQLSCPCCGFLKLHPSIICGLRTLEAIIGFQVVNGCMCVQEAKRWYKRENPSCQRTMFRTVPMYQGRGVCVKLDPSSAADWRTEIRSAMSACGLEMWTDGADLTYLAVAS